MSWAGTSLMQINPTQHIVMTVELLKVKIEKRKKQREINKNQESYDKSFGLSPQEDKAK